MGEGSRASASKRFICLLGCGAVGKKNGNILFSAGIGVTAGFRHKVSGGGRESFEISIVLENFPRSNILKMRT